ncbi:fungal trichothecene efflux pump [Microdochium trichocladiopsis]|uniref:Fungal trichothecene efflux pump n=1 Tax=Microdochium trichocladiopsis TaxID=1682393 RepID=A0A9P8Y6V8_9PEZI|nr:fungal trichothecene efflux pump [Microdochium trichocladiopsis]KAH7033240.1 fungal trichothecene efflux pump [Microdochium trichocladiopsis]
MAVDDTAKSDAQANPGVDHVERHSDSEKGERRGSYIPQSNEDYEVTFKTWIVVGILSASYGLSFWIVPALASCQAVVATQLGDVTGQTWYLALYLMTITIAFMICGANSDLFGRRWFLVFGNALLFVGLIIGGTAKSNTQMWAAMAITGFAAGNTQLAAFALPELLPNKWRHIAVVLADAVVLIAVVIGPIAGRYSVVDLTSEAWRWLFYVPAILAVFSFGGLVMYYYPPAHPRGLPFKRAIRELDYGGGLLFIIATTLILTGLVYTATLPSNDPKVIGTLVAGFATMVGFILYEIFAPLKQPLTPTHVFTAGKGRALTAPFIAAFVVTMFYYAINIIYPTMLAVFYVTSGDVREGVILTLPQNLGLTFGAVLLSLFGTKVGHWRWTLTGSVAIMVIFGALLALGTPDNKGMMIAFTFLAMTGFGWAQYLSIAYVQFGTDQKELGIAGGLAGVARFAGGAVAVAVYQTILGNVQSKAAAELIPAAATAAGLPQSSVSAFLLALPLGAGALANVPGVTPEIIAAGGAALQQSYVRGLRTTALSSLSFGILGIIACICCEDIDHKMNNKIEIYLENDVHADRNEFH